MPGAFDDLEMGSFEIRRRKPVEVGRVFRLSHYLRGFYISQVGFLAGFLVAICPVAWRWAWRCEQERFFHLEKLEGYPP